VIVIALLAGCAREGAELHEWTSKRAVTLPRRCRRWFAEAVVYATTTATLGDAARQAAHVHRRPLPWRSAVRIDGTPVANIGDTMVGEHRLISAEQSAYGQLISYRRARRPDLATLAWRRGSHR
jgi:hypothetical protein